MFTEKTIFEGRYHDVEKIAWEYGLKYYEMLVAEECSNGTYKCCDVRPEFSEDEWNNAVERKFLWRFGLILNRACFDGKIKAGEYFIDCSW